MATFPKTTSRFAKPSTRQPPPRPGPDRVRGRHRHNQAARRVADDRRRPAPCRRRGCRPRCEFAGRRQPARPRHQGRRDRGDHRWPDHHRGSHEAGRRGYKVRQVRRPDRRRLRHLGQRNRLQRTRRRGSGSRRSHLLRSRVADNTAGVRRRVAVFGTAIIRGSEIVPATIRSRRRRRNLAGGDLTVAHCEIRVTGREPPDSYTNHCAGGGIQVAGDLTLFRSRVEDNFAGDGGGIGSVEDGSVSRTRRSNGADSDYGTSSGGGIRAEGDIYSQLDDRR